MAIRVGIDGIVQRFTGIGFEVVVLFVVVNAHTSIQAEFKFQA
jgi:hypothetical protein